jgi:hypothetical protein
VAAKSGCVYKLSGDILVTLAVEGYGLAFNAKNPLETTAHFHSGACAVKTAASKSRTMHITKL